MKNKNLLRFGVLIGLLTLSLAGFGQKSVVKLNIFSPLVKTFNVSYEQKFNATSSGQLGFFYTGYSVNDTKFSGFGITPEYRFYLSETEAPQGVYLAPFIRYSSFKLEEKTTNSKGDFTAFGGGVIIGKQWIFKERVSLDIFIGPSYSSGSVKVTSGTDSFDKGVFDGFGIRTGLTLGLAF